MLHVFWPAVRRVAPLGAVAGGLVGLAFASVIMTDGGAVSEAAVTLLEFGSGFAVLFTTGVAAGSTATILRTARRAGVRPDREMLATEHTAETYLTDVPQRHANHLLGSLLDRLNPPAEVKHRNVESDGTASAVLACRSTTNFPVSATVRVAARDQGFTVTMRTAPAQTWKKLDGGASWEVLRHLLKTVDGRESRRDSSGS
uniref:Uncharacterized protein n=1 Tax=Streptomyces sp. NBC_00093 TaxID=2975649 RepID=A0AAU2ABG6_9ACTN